MITQELTSGQKVLLRKAPDDWTDVPRFANVNRTLDELERKQLIERRTVPGIGFSKQQWRRTP